MGKFSKSDYKYFDLARRAAQNSTYDGFKLGCVIVYKGHVVSSGHNSNKTNPMQKKYNKYRQFKYSGKPIRHSTHAEMNALLSIPYTVDLNTDYSKAKVYVYRISPGQHLGQGLARPCAACLAALRDKGVRDIYYTTSDGFAHERLF